MTQIIFPSLMAKNQKELNEDFKKLKGVAKTLHLDITDGKFVPNKTFQFPFKLSKHFTYNAHLMIKNPENWIKKNFKRINFFIPHFEEVKNIEKYIAWMKNKRKKVAFALLPETKVKKIQPYLSGIDYILILTVHPGFYGGKYLKSKLKKIPKIKKLNSKIKVIVDGGMNPQTIKQAQKAGADFFVSGSYTTKAPLPQQRINNLIKAIANYLSRKEAKMKLTHLKELQLMANQIRQDVISMLYQAGSGHPAGSLGMADVFTAFYFNILKHNPKKPSWKKRDRLILSNGHICPVRYAAMARSGYFPVKELETLRKLNSRLQGHPSRVDLPALELSTASLGQGLGVAVGMALAAKLNKQKHTIYCISSDGEHDEGSTWEAINAAQKYKLNNLINILDRNHIQISGYTHNVWPLEPLKEKYEAHNWKVFEINGHNFKQILSAVKKAKKINKPVCIIAYNIPGKGVSFMENKYQWHGKAPNKEEAVQALLELRRGRKKLLKKK